MIHLINIILILAHGKINAITYASDYRDTGKAQARVWTPYDYSENEKYNM